MQLNKMTYIAHGWSLAIYNERLIVENIEAWEYGPVVPILYHEFKRYGNSTVPHTPIEETKFIKESDVALLDKIIEVYGCLNGLQLSAMTHQKGTPWYRVWHSGGRNSIIPNDMIKEYYVEKAKQSSDGA
jgi:uncharacterized phage-associated protein